MPPVVRRRVDSGCEVPVRAALVGSDLCPHPDFEFIAVRNVPDVAPEGGAELARSSDEPSNPLPPEPLESLETLPAQPWDNTGKASAFGGALNKVFVGCLRLPDVVLVFVRFEALPRALLCEANGLRVCGH